MTCQSVFVNFLQVSPLIAADANFVSASYQLTRHFHHFRRFEETADMGTILASLALIETQLTVLEFWVSAAPL